MATLVGVKKLVLRMALLKVTKLSRIWASSLFKTVLWSKSVSWGEGTKGKRNVNELLDGAEELVVREDFAGLQTGVREGRHELVGRVDAVVVRHRERDVQQSDLASRTERVSIPSLPHIAERKRTISG